MDRAEKFAKVTEWFSANMDRAETELHYDSPFHLLIAVILSAQCTDRRVNMHTPLIFSRFPEPSDLAS
ncbi:MAG: endonuclease III, partial [Bacteroidales bacterium]|nr:endonuclease III [Bacteroidales bacterium]